VPTTLRFVGPSLEEADFIHEIGLIPFTVNLVYAGEKPKTCKGSRLEVRVQPGQYHRFF
jgi:hypothetical protein